MLRIVFIGLWLMLSAWMPATAQPPTAVPDTGSADSTQQVAGTDTTVSAIDSTRTDAVLDTAGVVQPKETGGIPWIAYVTVGLLIFGSGVAAWWFLSTSSGEAMDKAEEVRGHPVSLGRSRLIIGNAQDIGRRKEQQDAFGFSDVASDQAETKGLLAVVADGMGGMAHGSEASRSAVQAFLNAYATQPLQENIQTGLYQALMQAQASVREMTVAAGLQDGIGTTLIATVVHQDMLYWISVGDSHIYLLRDQHLTQLNVDHNYGLDLLRERAAGLINREEVLSNPDRQALTSFLGLSDMTLIDRNIKPFPLQTNDRILLCSDGLYGVLSEAEIMTVLQQDPQDACETLIAETIGKGFEQQDNVTAVALVCKQIRRLE